MQLQPQATTQTEVLLELVRISKLIEGTTLHIYDVYKYNNHTVPSNWNPLTSAKFENYTFAIDLLDGKPIFPGDTLWYYPVSGIPIQLTVNKDWLKEVCGGFYTWEEPKNTFTLNGEELPLPNITNTTRFYYLPEEAFSKYYWTTPEKRDLVLTALHRLLQGNITENK